MKLTLEISDSALRNAVEAEVGKAIANLAEAVIQAKFDAVLAAKIEHMQKTIPTQVGTALRSIVSDEVHSIMGSTTTQRQDFVRRVAAGIITETLKRAV